MVKAQAQRPVSGKVRRPTSPPRTDRLHVTRALGRLRQLVSRSLARRPHRPHTMLFQS